jgi:hypothetical protein
MKPSKDCSETDITISVLESLSVLKRATGRMFKISKQLNIIQLKIFKNFENH